MAEKRANNRLSVANITVASSYLWPSAMKNAARFRYSPTTFHSPSTANDFNSPFTTDNRAPCSFAKQRARYREEGAKLYLHQAATLIYTVVDIKRVSRRTHLSFRFLSLSLSLSLSATVVKSLFIFVQFGAQDNALVTDRQVWTKCPSRHSIGPRGYSSSLRPCCSGKAERNGPESEKDREPCLFHPR